MAHRVVAKVARQSAAKTRQAGAQRHFEALLVVSNKVQRIASGAFDHLAVSHHFGDGCSTKTARAQQRARRQTDKAVAAKALATNDGFEQKAVFAIALCVRQFQVQRQRGLKVGKGFRHQRNAVVALAGEAFEFKFSDHGGGSQLGSRSGRDRFIWLALCGATGARCKAKGDGGSVAGSAPSGAKLGWLTPKPSPPVAATCDE